MTREERLHRQNMYSQAYQLKHRTGPYSLTCEICGRTHIHEQPTAKTCTRQSCKRERQRRKTAAWRAKNKVAA